ncbi:MAG: aldehyde dehydrogenase family protein [Acidimicrobiales bacterium]
MTEPNPRDVVSTTVTTITPQAVRPRIDTVDPRTMAVTGSVPDQGAAEVVAAIGRARAAAAGWSTLAYRERAAHLVRVRDVLLDRADDLVATICAETGKLEAEAVTTEVMAVCELIGYYARHGEASLRPEKVPVGTLAHKRAFKVWEPYGVVGVISPWNYPFSLSMTPLLTALFAGNTVVLKPSEVTPLVGLAAGALFADAGAHPDIVQVVTGGGATGEALVRGGVDKVTFTGSVATGRRVMAAAADTLTPVVLELGGKDPMVVCADADLDRAARGAVWGAFQNAGQTCISVERVYVAAAVHDTFVEKVLGLTAAIRQGTGPGHDIGSMTFPPQLEVVESHLADAVARGARVRAGGTRVAGRDGLWFAPTVVTGCDHTMALLRDETFGPVLPIVAVADEAEAVRLANDSEYGLNSSVWTRDLGHGTRLAARLVAGNVCVNDVLVSYAVPALPFGGVKSSGIGRVHGPEGLREMSQVKSVLVDRFGWGREAWWFPVPGALAGVGVRYLRVRYRTGARSKLRGLLGRGGR